MSIDLNGPLQYGVLLGIIIVVANFSVNYYFARYTNIIDKSQEDKDREDVVENNQCIVEQQPSLPPQPKRYSIYAPTIFSKYLTRQFYVFAAFKSYAFFEEPSMKTLAEILSLLEHADNATVIKKGSKSIKVLIGTLGTDDAQTGEVFEAYNVCELCIKTADRFARLYEGGQYFQRFIFAILLLHIEEIKEIRHWSKEQSADAIRLDLARYLLRDLSLEFQNNVLDYIQIIHSGKCDNDVFTTLENVMNAVKNKIELTSKVIETESNIEQWPPSLHTKYMVKQWMTMDEIKRF